VPRLWPGSLRFAGVNWIGGLSLALAALVAASPAFAVSAHWLTNAGTGDWNTAGNWDNGVPNAAADVATFGNSFITGVSLSANTQVSGILFLAGANAFTITAAPTFTLTLSGTGITNNSGITQNFVTAVNGSGSRGIISFTNSATAGSNTAFTNNGATGVAGTNGGTTQFFNTSTAGSGTFTNNGATTLAANGGTTQFFNTSTAGSATLIANAGTLGGNGGSILFVNDSTGGTARVEVFGNGNLDISSHNAPGVTIGSIEGTGNVFLGARNLAVGSNDLSTIFSGVIQDGGINGGTGGSLTKTGAGKLTLSGANTYTGATTINTGTLNIQNATALGTTAGGTTVNDNATLQIQGGITVGAEALTLSGVQGKLESVSGANNYGGLLTLGTANGGFFPSHSFIISDAGSTLNLTNTGTITGTGSALYLSGAGAGSISSILGMTSSYLIKDGTGTWTLSGANTYNVSGNSTTSFGTSIYDGILKLSGAGTLGNASNGLYMDGAGSGDFGAFPTLDLNGTSQGVGNLDGGEVGSGGTIVNNGSGAVTFTIGNGNGGGGNYAGVIADHTSGTGTIALTKTFTGTITLAGANTYSALTTISGGILNIQNATALGTTASGTTVSSGATLQIQGGITVGAEALTIRGTGASGATGALENVSGTNNYGGLVTLGAASTISSDTAGDTLNLTNTGTITGATFGLTLTGDGNGSISSIIGTTTGTLTKNGFGTWTLLGSNTYTGATTINSGILNIQKATGLGTTAGGVTVNSGATLQIQSVVGITVGAEALTLNGGTLENVSGTNNYGGLVTVGAATAGYITSDAGTLNLTNTGTISGVGSALDLAGDGNGTISSIIGATIQYLQKDGAGTWTLSGANTYTSSPGGYGTIIDSGTLRLSGSGTLGNTSNGLLIEPYSGGTLDLNGTSQGVGLLVVAYGGTILNNGGSAVTLTIGNGDADGGYEDAGAVIADHTIGTGTIALTKTGTGTFTLSGANTYSGVTTISGGILNIQNGSALGATTGGTTVSSGATLQLQGGISVGAEALTIRGIGASGGTGALESVDGNNYGGLLTLGAASTISSDAGTLNLTNTGTITGATFGLTLTGSGNGSISSIIGTTSGAVIMNGAGTWTLLGANTYTGGTTVNGGILQLSGAGTLGGTSGALTVNTGGTLDLNATSQGVGNLTGTGGTIVNNGGGAVTLTIGNGNFGSGTYAGVIADHTSGIGTIALTKTGTAKITLSGANSYTGATTISNGILNIQSATALGTTAAGTTVGSGATLQIQGGITVGAEALTISGVGETTATGVLENVSGTNNYGGLVTLGAASTVSSDAGTLNLTNAGTITGATFALTLTGAGNGSISSIIGTTSGTLTKTGVGTWTLFGANTYTGATTISNGILNIQNATALGTTAAGTTVSSGATLQIQGDITMGAEALTISGVGETTATGALENVSGTNNYGGLLHLGAATTISSDAGTLNLTNTGTITGPLFGLTLTGAGDGSIASIIGTTSGTLTKTGTGTWTLSGANTYTGATTISGGILDIQSNTALGTTAGNTTVSSGATLQIQGDITVGTAEALTISGIGASGATGALENVSGTNNYGGLVTLGAASTISSDAGTLNLTNTGTITGATRGLTLTGAGNGSISSIIGTTTGTLTKSGTGNWTLSGANTYTGATQVNGGTLLVNGSTASGSAVSVTNSGSTLGGTGTINGTVAVNSGAYILGGTGAVASGTLTLNNSLTLNSGSIIELAFGGSFAHSTLARTGSGTWTFQSNQAFNFIDLGATTGFYNNIITGLAANPGSEGSWTIMNAGWTGTFSYDGTGDIDLTVTSVPEPSTWVGGALAFAALVFTQRRRFVRSRKP